MKAKDGYTWDDVNEMEEEDRKLAKQLKTTMEKVQKLEDIAATKRHKIFDLTKMCKEEERRIENILKDKIRIENERVRQAEK